MTISVLLLVYAFCQFSSKLKLNCIVWKQAKIKAMILKGQLLTSSVKNFYVIMLKIEKTCFVYIQTTKAYQYHCYSHS